MNVMRHYIDLLRESEIPETTYGYWIRANGSFLPTAKDGAHYPAVHAEFGSHTQDTASEYETAMKAGWIRVIANGNEFSADTYGTATSPRAVTSLFRLVASAQAKTYVHTDESLDTQKRCATAQDFRMSVRKAVSGV